MSCIFWWHKKSLVPVDEFQFSVEEPSRSQSSDDISVGTVAIPGGLAGIKQRMASLGHFMNDFNPQNTSNPDSSNQSRGNFPTNSPGSEPTKERSQGRHEGDHAHRVADQHRSSDFDGSIQVSADLCDNHGDDASATPFQPFRNASEGRTTEQTTEDSLLYEENRKIPEVQKDSAPCLSERGRHLVGNEALAHSTVFRDEDDGGAAYHNPPDPVGDTSMPPPPLLISRGSARTARRQSTAAVAAKVAVIAQAGSTNQAFSPQSAAAPMLRPPPLTPQPPPLIRKSSVVTAATAVASRRTTGSASSGMTRCPSLPLPERPLPQQQPPRQWASGLGSGDRTAPAGGGSPVSAAFRAAASWSMAAVANAADAKCERPSRASASWAAVAGSTSRDSPPAPAEERHASAATFAGGLGGGGGGGGGGVSRDGLSQLFYDVHGRPPAAALELDIFADTLGVVVSDSDCCRTDSTSKDSAGLQDGGGSRSISQQRPRSPVRPPPAPALPPADAPALPAPLAHSSPSEATALQRPQRLAQSFVPPVRRPSLSPLPPQPPPLPLPAAAAAAAGGLARREWLSVPPDAELHSSHGAAAAVIATAGSVEPPPPPQGVPPGVPAPGQLQSRLEALLRLPAR